MAFRKPQGTPTSLSKSRSLAGFEFLSPLPFKVRKLKKVDADIRKFAAAAAAKADEFIESDFEVPLSPRSNLASQSSFYKQEESSEDLVAGSEESDNLGHSLTQNLLLAGGAPHRARAGIARTVPHQKTKMSASTPSRAAHDVSSSSSDTDLDVESLMKVAKQQKPKKKPEKKPQKKAEKQKETAPPNGKPSMSSPMKTTPKGLAPSRPDTYSSSSDDDSDNNSSATKPYTGPTAPISPSVSPSVLQTVFAEAAISEKSKAPPKPPTSPRKKMMPPAAKTPSTTAASSKTSKTQVSARALELLRTPGAADVWLVHSVPGMDVQTLPSEALKKKRSQKPLGPFTAQHGGQYEIRQHQSTPMDTRLFVLGEDGQVVPGPTIKGEMFLMPFFERQASKKPVTKKAVADVPQKPERPLPDSLKMRNVPFGAGDGVGFPVNGQQKKKKKTKESREPGVEEEMEVTGAVEGKEEEKKRAQKRKEEVHEEHASEKKKKKKKRKSEPIEEQVEAETEEKEKKKKKKKKKKSMSDE